MARARNIKPGFFMNEVLAEFSFATEQQVMLADVDVMDWNRLRARVLLWNLEGFFTYWAEESAKDAASQAQATSTGI